MPWALGYFEKAWALHGELGNVNACAFRGRHSVMYGMQMQPRVKLTWTESSTGGKELLIHLWARAEAKEDMYRLEAWHLSVFQTW